MSNETGRVTRKLRAILSADVKGYSLLMADDEAHTIKTLKVYRHIMSDLIQQHSGRVVDNPGDNLLAEFSSAVDAVECAVKIQNMLKKENAKFVEERQLQFRIGINIGDVVQDGDRIYGSGVNVAARIEGIADPSGICISRSTYDQIKDKSDLNFEYIGEHAVKNIEDPVKVYKVLTGLKDTGKLIGEKRKSSKLKWAFGTVAVLLGTAVIVMGGIYWKYFYLPVTGDSIPNSKMISELPKGPSVAVLPFDNMTGDSEQDYLCDGFTEHIISTLSYSQELFVIARNSSFAFRGKQKTVKQIGKELNADWIIEGSIQKYEKRVRITVQLIDASSGHHKFSKTYDRELEDIFKLQDEIAFEIAKEMQITLVMGESIRNIFEGAKAPQEIIKIYKGYKYQTSGKPEDIQLAQKELFEVIDINPNIPYAYTTLSHSYISKIWLGRCESNAVCLGRAIGAVKKAFSLNENFDHAYMASGAIFLIKGEHQKAINALEKAIVLNPSNAEAYYLLGNIRIMADQLEEALESLNNALQLNPFPSYYYYESIGTSYLILKQFDRAIEFYNKSLEKNQNAWSSQLGLAGAYSHLGEITKAKRAMSEVLRIYPDFSMNDYLESLPLKNEQVRDFFIEGAKKAGLVDSN